MNDLCLQCVGEHLSAHKSENGEQYNPNREQLLAAGVMESVTSAPSWQGTMVGPGQQVVSCVPTPTCAGHIAIAGPQQTGRSGSGLLVPGGMN